MADSSILGPPVRIGDGLHTREDSFAFLPSIEPVRVTKVEGHHSTHPPMALEAVVILLAICALVQSGRIALGHLLGLIARLRFA